MKSEQVWARLIGGARQLLQADAAAVRLLRTGQGDGAILTVVTTTDPVTAIDQSEQIEMSDSPLDELIFGLVFVSDHIPGIEYVGRA